MDADTIHEILNTDKYKYKNIDQTRELRELVNMYNTNNKNATLTTQTSVGSAQSSSSSSTGEANAKSDSNTNRMTDNDEDLSSDDTEELGENGLVIGKNRKIVLPKELLEIVLSCCDPKVIHLIGGVCKSWRSILKGLPFWKLVFGRHNLTNEWDKIKDHVQSHPDIWQVYLAELKHKFIDRNLVKNHSGHEGLAGWTFMSGEPDGWSVESNAEYTAYGIKELPPIVPPEPASDSKHTYCFATNQFSCSKEQCIDLWKVGLTPPVIRACVPFRIMWSEMVSTPTGKSGKYETKVSFLDRDLGQISPYSPYECKIGAKLNGGTQWRVFSHEFDVTASNVYELLEELRYFYVYHGAMANRSTVGHYGPKIARTTVKVQFLPSTQRDEV